MQRLIPWIVIGLLFSITTPVLSQDILVWDKDHDKMFFDPDGAGMVDATFGITRALDTCGETYDESSTLPVDLTPYSIIFIVMGNLC